MAHTEDKITGGINALFGNEPSTKNKDKTREELISEQSSRRLVGRGRPRKGSAKENLAKDDMHTSVIVNKPQYDKLKEIALKEGLLVKEIIYYSFELAIEKYEKKNGPVVLERPKGKKELFG